jgi:hypothetical protein
MLEHVYRDDAERLFREAHRVLNSSRAGSVCPWANLVITYSRLGALMGGRRRVSERRSRGERRVPDLEALERRSPTGLYVEAIK